MVSHAKRVRAHQAGKILYMDAGEVAIKHNQGQSFLWGSASSVQLAIYRKDIQARAMDKLDFWRTQWEKVLGEDFDKPAYDPTKPVWRIELRFHHSVMNEFGQGEYEKSLIVTKQGNYALVGADPRKACATVDGVSRRLVPLWRYGLDIFRLEMEGKGAGRFIDPMWQLLDQEADFREPFLNVTMKRVRKTQGFGNERNIGLALGNMLSIMARNGTTPESAWQCIKVSGIYDDIYQLFLRRATRDFRPFDEAEIFEFIRKGLQKRTLMGKAA